MTSTTLLGLPLIDAGQSQKHVTHNQSLLQLDPCLHLAVQSRNVLTPAVSPVEGARYLCGAAGTGAFAGKANQIAVWQNGAWVFLAPQAGWRAYIVAENLLIVFDGTTWRDPGIVLHGAQSLDRLGIGTSVDPNNPLSVKLNASLFTALSTGEGGSGDLRIALNKSAPGNTASQIYSTGYSGRAETGLSGDDRFRLKVSADGASWRVALDVDPASGTVNFPSGFAAGSIASATSLGVVKVGNGLAVAADGTLSAPAASANLSIGTVTSGPAAATITGTSPNQKLNLTIPAGASGPQGATGAAGPANTLSIGTVTTGAAGSSAAATITGSAPSQTLNLTIPQGMAGQAGGSYVLPAATSSALGGVKASAFLQAAADGTLTPQFGAWLTIAGAATLDLGAQASLNIVVSGAATISSFGATATSHGLPYTLRFLGASTLVNGATLILPGGANITSAAGDIADVVWDGAGVWRVISFQRASGASLVSGSAAASTPSFRNRLYNGSFALNQRGYVSGAATTIANQYTFDRWRVVTIGQSLVFSTTGIDATVTAPAGGIEQVIEGTNIEGGSYVLSWSGTASAAVNGVAVANGGGVVLASGAAATVRFTSGTVTRPQLEPGTTATSFERRPLSLELALCQRYFEAVTQAGASSYGAAAGATITSILRFAVPKRAVPTLALASFTTINCTITANAAVDGLQVIATAAATGPVMWANIGNVTASAEL